MKGDANAREPSAKFLLTLLPTYGFDAAKQSSEVGRGIPETAVSQHFLIVRWMSAGASVSESG